MSTNKLTNRTWVPLGLVITLAALVVPAGIWLIRTTTILDFNDQIQDTQISQMVLDIRHIKDDFTQKIDALTAKISRIETITVLIANGLKINIKDTTLSSELSTNLYPNLPL